ncbi:MAG: tRNA (N(6)-L-threonylcarbamoyladenosine(37)-C(2))-methylthiotransferase MtaB, partial [Clostridiales bacterium]|nr:tRNA (N(6)-L-threonylcarbamoyladenosine(37)-C(2))-methylthiotransferase MtaB [Clostridiales bacterium]
YETEAVLSAFCEKGWHVIDFSQKADVYIVNTCAVTGTSGRKSRQMLRQAKETNPAAVVVAVGCFSQLEPEAVSAIADVVVGTKERGNIPLLVEQYILTGRKKISVGDIKTERIFEPLQLGDILERTRAFVKIQDGCDRYCSYCAIPYARGAVRSRPLSDIAKEAERLVKSGFREIVLSGIHLASFGKDFQERTTLTDAIDVTLSSGIERIRLGSLEPNVITDSFIEYLKVHKNVCPHFHLSLQSGSDKILRSMRRAYDTATFLRSAESLYENFPDCAITTDMITGFPGETEQDFYDSLTFAEKIGFMKIHVFPFSKKDGTKAASMEGQITKHVKSERAKKAIDLSQKLTQKFFSKMEGKFVNVLVEKTESGESFGYAENYVPVCIKKEVHSGEIVRVKLDSYDAEKMFSGI